LSPELVLLVCVGGSPVAKGWGSEPTSSFADRSRLVCNHRVGLSSSMLKLFFSVAGETLVVPERRGRSTGGK
jgi:hypothetical protein